MRDPKLTRAIKSARDRVDDAMRASGLRGRVGWGADVIVRLDPEQANALADRLELPAACRPCSHVSRET